MVLSDQNVRILVLEYLMKFLGWSIMLGVLGVNYYSSILIFCCPFYTLESADFLCSKNIDYSRIFTTKFLFNSF